MVQFFPFPTQPGRAMFHRRPSSPASGEDENHYALSFSDLLANLLAIFMLALVVLMIRLDQQTSRARETQAQVQQSLENLAQLSQMRRELLEEVRKRLLLYEVQVEISDNYSVLRIPETQLHFASGQWDIPAEKSQALTLIGQVLAESLQYAPRLQFIDTVFIEGHTDSAPLTHSAMGNWGLSTYRAVAVWKFWTESPGAAVVLKQMRNRHGQPLFSVSGYADTRRIANPDLTDADRQRNRRIDIRFTMRTPLDGDLLDFLSQLKAAGVTQ